MGALRLCDADVPASGVGPAGRGSQPTQAANGGPPAPGRQLPGPLKVPLTSAARAGSGVWVFDTDGEAYLDGSSGAVVTGTGHAHPKVLAAMVTQAQAVTFTHRGSFSSQASETLAERLCQLTGYQGPG